MIQDDDDVVVGKIMEHNKRLHAEIWYYSERVVNNLWNKSWQHKKIDEVLIANFDIESDDRGMGGRFYVTLQIPREFRFITKQSLYKNKKELTDRVYMKILQYVTSRLPQEEHDMHGCKIYKIELLDDWSRYEARL